MLRKPGNPVELECANLPERFFSSYAVESGLSGFDSYLEDICSALDLDVSEFKVDLGKQTGGYTDFYHAGSGGITITGMDAVFGLVSRAIAGSRNSAVNSRIKSLQTLLFYNKLVAHFYKNVLHKYSVPLLLAFIPKDDVNLLTDSDVEVATTPTETRRHEKEPKEKARKNKTALTGFMLWIVAFVTFFVVALIGGVADNAMLLGLFVGLSVAVLGLILSIIGVVKNKQYKKRRKGLAIAGIVINTIEILFCLVLIIAS